MELKQKTFSEGDELDIHEEQIICASECTLGLSVWYVENGGNYE